MTMCCAAAAVVWGCSATRHVPSGSQLLESVTIRVDDSSGVSSADFVNYLRQQPNHKVLGFAKLQLGLYNMSGRDSSRWYNRWLQRLGEAPVIYDGDLTAASVGQLRQALVNRGYMGATVEADTAVSGRDGKRVGVTYSLRPGERHVVRSLQYEVSDSALRSVVMGDSVNSLLRVGDGFDRGVLDSERSRVTQLLRGEGYYGFSKDYVRFVADTAENSLDVDLMLVVDGRGALESHERYVINRVTFVAGGTGLMNTDPGDGAVASDTVRYRGIYVVYRGGDRYIVPSLLDEKCFLKVGDAYTPGAADRTYEALSQLGIVRSVRIDARPVGRVDGQEMVDVVVYLTRNKKQGVTLELEGTNSEGDFGFGVGVAYQHRDLGRRSNLLTGKVRVNYESLSGNFGDLINDRYTEYAAEVGIGFPKFMMPFLSRGVRERSKASTEFAASFNYQERPEYTRVIAGAAWKYKWNSRDNRVRRTWDLVDVNYVYLPESTIDFINQIAPSNPLLRYSYEDHFIMRMGYTLRLTNRRVGSVLGGQAGATQNSVYTFRGSVETAGNLLYAMSSLCGQKRDDGVYKLFGIQYAQYAKAEFDWSLTRRLSGRSSMAFHVGAGVGVPYGNSRVLPFEKRFYAGGANGVRGWSVRTLGPGSFDSRNSVTDFINQCGDIRLDLSMEYRAKLWWVFEGAAFVDAGNVWTIHCYENQPGGMFRFNSFWKQIALAYGVGVRMDFSYFLLRFDLGVKAYNPAMNQVRWPLLHPRWGRDTAFHFSVGYPF